MTPSFVSAILENKASYAVARVLLTLPFWASGLAKLIDFQGGAAEMEHYGFTPGAIFNIAVIIVQLGGSLLVILNRAAWLGAGALGVFTALTILLVHTFWTKEGESAMISMFFALEHIGMIGGLILATILSIKTSPAA